MHYASSSSMAVALVASAALFASQAEALPTSRSTSTVARRAHIASHHSHRARAVLPADRSTTTTLGDHSIVVDASTSSTAGQGGIKNSTINLTSISKRKADHEGTLSSLSRVVRSLFRRAVPAAPDVFKALPLTYSAPVSSGGAAQASHKKKRRTHQRRTVKKPRANAPLKGNTRTLPNGLIVELGDAHDHHHITNVKRKRAQAVAAAQAAHERRATNYTLAAAQASIYSAAVAALGDSEPTATPVLDAYAAVPMMYAGNVTLAAPAALNDTTEPDVSVSLSPVTLTITLVPSGPNGALVNAAHLPQATAAVSAASSYSADPLVSSSSLTSSSTTVTNPKAAASALAAAAALSSSSTREQSPDPTSTAVLAALSAYVPPAAPSASTSSSAALGAVKRGMERRVVPAKRAPGVHARRAPVAAAATPLVKLYLAPLA